MIKAVLQIVMPEKLFSEKLISTVKDCLNKNKLNYNGFEGRTKFKCEYIVDLLGLSCDKVIWEVKFETTLEARLFFTEFICLISYINKNLTLGLSDNDYFVALSFEDLYGTINADNSNCFDRIYIKDWNKPSDVLIHKDKYMVLPSIWNFQDLDLYERIFKKDIDEKIVYLNEEEMNAVLKTAKLSTPEELNDLSFTGEDANITIVERSIEKFFIAPEIEKNYVMEASDLFGANIISVEEDKKGTKKFFVVGVATKNLIPAATSDDKLYVHGTFKNLELDPNDMFGTSLKSMIVNDSIPCNKEEAMDFYLKFDGGERPKLISKDELTENTPCGIYILVDI